MRFASSLGLAVAMLGTIGTTNAQSTLGELMDRGAVAVRASDFRREIVGMPVRYLTPGGLVMELVYVDSGILHGRGYAQAGAFALGALAAGATVEIEGTWAADDKERICASMRYGATVLPARCEYWFKFDDAYFVSDSDSDRLTKVGRRTLKR